MKVKRADSGFAGTESDFSGIVNYIHKVNEYQKEHDQKLSSLWKIPDTPKAKSKLRDTFVKSKADFELPWLKSLREKIDAALSRYFLLMTRKVGPVEAAAVATPVYDALRSKERTLDAQLAELRKPKLPELSLDALAIVKNAMGPGNRLLVTAYNVSIHQHDIQTLRPGTWLNDEVILY